MTTRPTDARTRRGERALGPGWRGLWGLLVLCLGLLWNSGSAQVSVTRTSSAVFYIDPGASPSPLRGMYTSYRIENTGTTTLPDVWVGVGGFTGGVVSLAPNEDGVVHLGTLAPGAANARTAFFYLQASAATTAAQTHTVSVYPTRPPTGALGSASFSFTGVSTAIEASANKVTSTVAGPNPAAIGGTLTLTVQGDTGTIGAAGILSFTPAAYLDWRADAYELVGSRFTLPNGSVVTDQLLVGGYTGAAGPYTLVYTFRAVGSTAAPTAVSPVGYISSGAQIKHTSTGSFAGLTPIQPASNTLTLTKLATPGGGLPGTTVTYTLRLTNSGSAGVSADALVDTLPTTPGTPTYVAGSSTFGGTAIPNPTVSGATLTWTGTFTVPPGGFSDLTFRVTMPAAQGNYLNSAVGQVGGTQIDTTQGTADNAPATAQFSVGTPDLTLTKTHGGTFTQGQVGATYTLTASNGGAAPTSGTVTLTDALPAGLTATALGGSGWTCTLTTLTCTRSDALAGGASYPPVTLTVTVAANAPASVTNTAGVSGGGETNTANSGASDPTTVTPAAPDLTLTKSHAGTFTVGQPASFTFRVGNTGTAPSGGTISLIDALPSGLSLPDGAVALSGPQALNWTCTSASNTVTCGSVAAIAAGGSSTFTIGGLAVGPGAAPGVTNTASVGGGGESNTGNNSGSDTVTVLATDLTLSKTHGGDFSQGQTGATYTLSVSNVGTAPTSGTVTVTDTLPSGLTATALGGSGWTCLLATLSCARSDTLGAGASFPPVTLTVDVAYTAPTSVTNTAAVSGGGDAGTAGNAASDPTTVTPSLPDLTLSKTHGGDFFQGQTGATYTLTVSNVGTAPTSGTVTVTDSLPGGLTATALAGPGWTCTLATLTCTRMDLLALGASFPPITLTVDVAPGAPASVTNTASVGGGLDMSTANNTAADPTTVVPRAPDLTLSKSHGGNFTVGQPASFTFTVGNVGTGPAGQPTLSDPLPAGLSLPDGPVVLSGANAADWSCTSSANVVTCTGAALAAGSGSTFALTGIAVAASAAPGVTNTASVNDPEETATGNNTASDTATVLLTDLTVTKTHGAGFSPGGTGQYTIAVGNAGTAPSAGPVTVTDTLPAPLTATALSGVGWSCTLATLTCTRADSLAPGASFPAITLDVTVAPAAPPSTTNTVTVSGGGDGDAANNTAQDLTLIPSGFTLGGTVYADGDASGGREREEAGLPGVPLTLRDAGGAVVATTTSDAAGAYRFDLLPPGPYTVTQTPPAGYLATSPTTLGVSVTTADVTGLNFGVFAGVRLQGEVFRDDGWGGTAHDALRGGSEVGVPAFRVTATNAGGRVASALTDGAGRYVLFLPVGAGAVTVTADPAQGPTFTATGVSDGTAALHLATGAGDPLASRSVVDPGAVAGQTLTRTFGLVPALALTPDGAQNTDSPGSVLYRHRLTPGTAGSLTFTLTPGAGSPLHHQLWQDVDGDGAIDPGTDLLLLPGAGETATLTLTAGGARRADGTLADVLLIVAVSVPPGVPGGLADPARLTVTQTLLDRPGVVRTAGVTDTTRVGAGGLRLSKFVRNVTAGTGFSGAGTQGSVGDELEYCIHYHNLGRLPLEALTLTDPVPHFTEVQDGYGPGLGVRWVVGGSVAPGGTATPGTAADNRTSVADGDAAALTSHLLTVEVGDVPAGQQGVVCYRVGVR